MLNRSLIYICLLGLSSPLIAMDAPPRLVNQANAVKNHDLALALNTIYEITQGIATDLLKSLQNSKPKVALKFNLSQRVAVLNDLIERLPNSLVQLKQALIAFGKASIAYDMASNNALISECITLFENANELLCQTIETLDSRKAECLLCFDEKNITDFITLSCGHEYCGDCIKEMITVAIKNGKAPCCPDPRCNKPLEYEEIKAITSSRRKLALFSDIKLRELLVTQNVKQCPTVDCPGAFINERTDRFTHKCQGCKQQYCGQCLLSHDTVTTTCAKAKADRDLAENADAANAASEQWKQQNTKMCPRCKTSVEKDGGCNHMTCRTCRYEFCWNCLKNWNQHSYCQADQTIPAQPAQNAAQEQAMNRENEHLLFARDPRGLVNRVLEGRLRGQDIAERFLALTCEQQNEWIAQISHFARTNRRISSFDAALFWLTALANLEPFTIHIASFRPEPDTQLNVGRLEFNRQVNSNFIQQLSEFLGSQNPNDMIFINDRAVFDTSLSHEQFQAALNRAIAHFRNYPLSRLTVQAPQPRVQPHNQVRENPAMQQVRDLAHMQQAQGHAQGVALNLFDQLLAQQQNRVEINNTITIVLRAPNFDAARFTQALTIRHGEGRSTINIQGLGNGNFSIQFSSNRLYAFDLMNVLNSALHEFGYERYRN